MVEPVGVQYVMVAVMLTLPVGVTVQDCVALPPVVTLAVTANAFEVRDSACVGVQEMVLPESAAPEGAVVSEKVIGLESGDVAAS